MILHWPDVVNGTYEGIGGFFIWLSVRKLHREKIVRGVSWVHVAFFGSWGYWNLYYYPHLDQWISFAGGVGITLMNTIWFGQMVYYLHRESLTRRGPRAD
jgi:hypothetical protein